MQFGRPQYEHMDALRRLKEQDLPGFVVFSSGTKGPSGGDEIAADGGGCRPLYQGVQFRTQGDPVLYLSNPPGVDAQLQRDSLDAIKELNQIRLNATGDPEIATRINSFEMAFRMQGVAPDLMDIAKEVKETLELYGAEPGKPSFANNCLLARRLVEKGVRFVQLYHEAWDQHGNLVKDLQKNCINTGHAAAAPWARRTSSVAACSMRLSWSGAGNPGRTPIAQGAPMDATIIPTPSPCGWPVAASRPEQESARPMSLASML